MKKIVVFTLLLCLVLTLAACGKVEITMQELYDVGRTEAMLKNRESVHIRSKIDGELWREIYLSKEYAYDHIPDEEFPWEQFMTDEACYRYDAGSVLLYLFITPDGVGNFASERAEHYGAVILGEDALGDTIESVTKKDGRITVKSVCGQEILAEFGVASAQFEYVLDAKTGEIISAISDYSYDDGAAFNDITEVTYDEEAPDMLKKFLGYVNQTENLRNVTVVSNHGTEKEESKSIKAPKGLIIGFEFGDDFENAVGFYTDAACTESYDPFADTDSDLTIYVKWTLS